MSKLGTIIKHEFKLTAANRAFIIITLIGPFLILAVAVLPGVLANKSMANQEAVVGIVGLPPEVFEGLQQAVGQTNISLISGENQETYRKRTLEEKINGYAVIPDPFLDSGSFTYYSKSGTDIYIAEALKGILGGVIIQNRIIRAGLEDAEIGKIIALPAIETRALATDQENTFFSILMTAIAFVMLLYMTVLLYGQMIGRAVLMEKTSKTVEIMLSSVRPGELMMGKIFGRGLAGLLQYGVWVLFGIIIINILNRAAGIDLPASFSIVNMLYLMVCFILAFFLYSSLYAALGASARDEQHLGQLGWPLIIFLVLPMVMISSLVMNPGSSLVKFLSYFPLTSPIVMFIRLLIASPKFWEVILSLVILLVTIALVIAGAAKIFRVGILMTGKKYTFKEIIRWLRF